MCKNIQHRLGNNVRIPIKLIHSMAMNGQWSFGMCAETLLAAGKSIFLKHENKPNNNK